MNSREFFEATKPFATRVLMEPQVYGHAVIVEPQDRPRLLNDPEFALQVVEQKLAARLQHGGKPLDIAVQCRLPAAAQTAEYTQYAAGSSRPALARIVAAAAGQKELPRWRRNHAYACVVT